MALHKILPLLSLFAALSLLAQAPPPAAKAAPAADSWEPLRFLAGTWEGKGSGKPGEVLSGTCSFAFELGDTVLVRRNRAEIAPRSGDGGPLVHEDLLTLYREAGETGWRAIYFDNEGHTIHYAVTVPAAGQVVFESVGDSTAMRFRLTHTLLPDGTLSTEFALAPPGGEFKTYTKGVTRRVR